MRYSRERLLAVLRKHGSDNISYYRELSLISRGNINENVAGVECDFAVFRVDDWWHGENPVLPIIDNRVYG